MATTPSTVELPRHLDPHPTVRPSTTWSRVREHRILLGILAVVAFVLWTLAAVEFGHWMAEGFPPLLPHLQEAAKHMAGLVANWMWRPQFIR